MVVSNFLELCFLHKIIIRTNNLRDFNDVALFVEFQLLTGRAVMSRLSTMSTLARRHIFEIVKKLDVFLGVLDSGPTLLLLVLASIQILDGIAVLVGFSTNFQSIVVGLCNSKHIEKECAEDGWGIGELKLVLVKL